jgi:hypothetical protein
MHLQNTSAWQLRCDFPEYLQFSGAIAQQGGSAWTTTHLPHHQRRCNGTRGGIHCSSHPLSISRSCPAGVTRGCERAMIPSVLAPGMLAVCPGALPALLPILL